MEQLFKISKNFLCKSEVCDRTMMSGALDKSVFNGNTFFTRNQQRIW